MHFDPTQIVLLLIFTCIISCRKITLTQQFFTNSFTDGDVALWSVSGTNAPISHTIYQCNGTRLAGGYQVFTSYGQVPTFIPISVSKIFTTSMPHYALNIIVTIYKIDSWVGQSFFLMIDGVSHIIKQWDATNGGNLQMCGQKDPVIDSINSNYNEVVFNLNITLNHTRPTLNITMGTNLNNNKGSWGFRQFSIIVLACEQTCNSCANQSLCSSCNSAEAGLSFNFPYCKCLTSYTLKDPSCIASSCVSCLADCTSIPGFYQNGTYCLPCNTACSACNGPQNSASNCQICAVGFWRSNSALSCSKCFKGCASCNGLGPNNCLSCDYGYFQFGTQCIYGSCPATTYGLENLKQCFNCLSPCLNCFGGSTSHCLSCTANNYLYNGTCVSSCPLPLIKFNWTCISQCPKSTFLANTGFNPECISCISNCESCTNTIQCNKCLQNFFLLNGLCVSTCPISFFQFFQASQSLVASCQPCHATCLACSGYSQYECDSCNPGSKLFSSQCVSTCPTSTFTTVLSCQICHQSCLQCTGRLQNQCKSCSYPLFYHLNRSSCLESCLAGNIIDNQLYQCYECNSQQVSNGLGICVNCSNVCSDCFNHNFYSCSSCSNTPYMQVLLVNQTCVLANDQRIIKSPVNIYTIDQTYQNFCYNMSIILVFANLIICLAIEIVFTYKSNILISIEFLQYLSFFYYVTVPYPSVYLQKILLFSYYSHLSSIIPQTFINGLFQIEKSQGNVIPTKMILNGKTGVYLLDTLTIHVLVILIVLVFFFIRAIQNLVGRKFKIIRYIYILINPYLIAYTIRILCMQLFLSKVLYISTVNFAKAFEGNILQILSFILLLIDIILIGSAMLWKINVKDQNQKDASDHQKNESIHKQYALIYYNQLGEHIQSSYYGIENEAAKQSYNDTQIQKDIQKQGTRIQKSQKQAKKSDNFQNAKPNQNPHNKNRKMYPIITILSKLIPCIILVVFARSPFVQCLSLVVFYLIFGFLHVISVISYRRRVYRLTTYVCASMLLILSVLTLVITILYQQGQQQKQQIRIIPILMASIVWLNLGFLCLLSLFQIVFNWYYFMRFLKWLISKVKILCYSHRNQN